MARMRIKELLKDRGIPRHYIATLFDVTDGAVEKWCSGETVPSARILPELARTLNCTIDELYDKEG